MNNKSINRDYTAQCRGGVIEAQQTIQFEGRGSSPTPLHHYKIKEGKFNQFSHLLKKYHYKSSKMGGGISHNLILMRGLEIVGGVVIGKMRHEKNYETSSIELRRMVLHPSCPKNTASYFLSKVMWWLKKNTDVSIVYSFADATVGHKGTIYKASNFKFIKSTPPTTHVLWKGQRYHPRSLTIDRPYSYAMREAVKTGEAIVEKGKPKKLFAYEIKRKNQFKQSSDQEKLRE
ncbi:MAG: Mom family adenine methylcarbamoylation protein [Promethearchaeota archaeon]